MLYVDALPTSRPIIRGEELEGQNIQLFLKEHMEHPIEGRIGFLQFSSEETASFLEIRNRLIGEGASLVNHSLISLYESFGAYPNPQLRAFSSSLRDESKTWDICVLGSTIGSSNCDDTFFSQLSFVVDNYERKVKRTRRFFNYYK